MSYNSVLGYGFRIFLKDVKKFENIKQLIDCFNLKNKSYISYNCNNFNNEMSFISSHNQFKIFICIDKYRNNQFKPLLSDEIISNSKILNISVSNEDEIQLTRLQKELNNLGLIYDEKLGWSLFDYID